MDDPAVQAAIILQSQKTAPVGATGNPDPPLGVLAGSYVETAKTQIETSVLGAKNEQIDALRRAMATTAAVAMTPDIIMKMRRDTVIKTLKTSTVYVLYPLSNGKTDTKYYVSEESRARDIVGNMRFTLPEIYVAEKNIDHYIPKIVLV